MKYMDWAAMGAASSAYAEASRARSENEELWQQNLRHSYELGRLQDARGKISDEISLRKLENKSAFDQTLFKVQNLFNELEITPEMRNHLRGVEEACLEQERLRAEKAANAPARALERKRQIS